MRKAVVVGTGLVVLTLVVGAGAWMLLRRSESESVSSSGGSISLGGGSANNKSEEEGSVMMSQTEAADSGSGAGSAQPGEPVQMQSISGGGEPGGASASTQGKVLDPSEFGEYESYKNQQSGVAFDLVTGNGAVAAQGKKVKVNYRGWLTNGTVFDESYKRGQPFEFSLGAGQVISGWDEGVKGMKVGSKRRLVLPPVMAYGTRSVGSIPANSVLIFDVELLGVQ